MVNSNGLLEEEEVVTRQYGGSSAPSSLGTPRRVKHNDPTGRTRRVSPLMNTFKASEVTCSRTSRCRQDQAGCSETGFVYSITLEGVMPPPLPVKRINPINTIKKGPKHMKSGKAVFAVFYGTS